MEATFIKIKQAINLKFDGEFKVRIVHDYPSEIPRLSFEFNPEFKIFFNEKFCFNYNIFELMDIYDSNEFDKFLDHIMYELKR